MARRSRTVTIARASEAVFALIGLFFVLDLPWPTSGGPFAMLWLHWGTVATVATFVAWRLARPTPAIWWLAVVLSAYILIGGAVSSPALREAARAAHGPGASLAVAIAGLSWLTQLVVAVCLYRLRAARRGTRIPVSEAPAI